MKKTVIVMLVDTTQEMLDELRAHQAVGKDYAMECEQVLVNEWGAQKESIDHEAWNDMAMGHILACFMDNAEDESPSEFVAKRLAMFSDRGLAISGLDRARYEMQFSFRNIVAYAKKRPA